MKVLETYVRRGIDNGDYTDVDVITTIESKHNQQYLWSPYVEIVSGEICLGHYQFAENRDSAWEDCPGVPETVKQEHLKASREVAEQLGVNHLRLRAVMTKHYDLDRLSVAGSNGLASV